MIGKIDILHVTKGHEVFEFNDPNEAKAKIDELVKGGYLLSAEINEGQENQGKSYKLTGFDPEKSEYVAVGDTEFRIPMNMAKVTAIPPTAGG